MISDAVLTTFIITCGTIVVGWFGVVQTRAAISRKRAEPADEESDEKDAALLRYENSPGEFVKDVLADNKAKGDEMRALRADMQNMRDDMKLLRDDLDATRRNDIRFRDALGRWMTDILSAWGVAAVMPKPRESDKDTLAAIIPTTL